MLIFRWFYTPVHVLRLFMSINGEISGSSCWSLSPPAGQFRNWCGTSEKGTGSGLDPANSGNYVNCYPKTLRWQSISFIIAVCICYVPEKNILRQWWELPKVSVSNWAFFFKMVHSVTTWSVRGSLCILQIVLPAMQMTWKILIVSYLSVILRCFSTGETTVGVQR